MYVIYVSSLNQYFCKDHSKIITFKDQDKANWFLQQFFNYAMTQINTGEGIDLMAFAQIPMTLQSAQIIPLPESLEAETIDFDEFSNI